MVSLFHMMMVSDDSTSMTVYEQHQYAEVNGLVAHNSALYYDDLSVKRGTRARG